MPRSTLPHDVQLRVDNAWTSILGDVRNQAVDINAGRRDESSRAEAGRCTLRLNNRAGQYSPRNPTSPLYGKIGRNTPLRVRLGDPQVEGLLLPGQPGSYAQTPSQASLNISADIDIRVELDPASWRPDLAELVSAKWASGGDISWAAHLRTDGVWELSWSPDGTSGSRQVRGSTVAIPDGSGRLAVRATLDADNGASGHDVTFFTAPDFDGPWTQLGSVVTTAGTTSIHVGDTPLTVGATADRTAAFSNAAQLVGHVLAVEVRDGIDGTVVADPVFTDQEAGDRAFTDTAGRLWTLEGSAIITDASIRFAGEVSAWPPRWNLADTDVWVPIEASGILRRLEQGNTRLQSPLYVDLSSRAATVAYWPMEDGERATLFAPGIEGLSAATFAGDVRPAEYDGFVASAPLPVFRAGGYFRSRTPAYEGAAEQRMLGLMHVPDDGTATGEHRLYGVLTTGTVRIWEIRIDQDGNLAVVAFDGSGNQVENSGFFAYNINGLNRAISLRLTQDGADVDWQMGTFAPGGSVAAVINGVAAGHTYGRISGVDGPRVVDDLNGTALGHVTVLDGVVGGQIWDIIGTSLTAWTNELAGDRLARLALDADLPMRITGSRDDTERVGPQTRATVLDLFAEIAAADISALGEQRDQLGLSCRLRTTLYNQPVALTLDYSNGEIFDPIEPTDDDQTVRNDVTASRVGGSSARAVRETGPLSVQDPPDGVGRYEESVSLNVAVDDQLPDQAGWRLRLGTVDEARLPVLTIKLSNPRMLAKLDAIMALVDGDRIQVINTPSWLPPGPLDLIIQGRGEQLGIITHEIVFNCTPASPWAVAVQDDPDLARCDTDGSELARAINSVDTELVLRINDGPNWVTGSTPEFDFPIELRLTPPTATGSGGEVVSATAIDGPGSDHRPAADNDSIASTSHVAPSVTPVRDDAVLICAWCTWSETGTYTVPASMTEHAQTSGTFSTMADATEIVPAAATGTRTATFSIADAWAAASDSYDAVAGLVVEEQLSGFGASDDVTLITSESTRSGWFLIAVHGWDEDPSNLMPPPTPGNWVALNDTGGPTSGTSRIRVWARQADTDGPQTVVFDGSSVTDNHARLYVFSGQFEQVFTVVRGLKGVQVAHPAGTDIRLATPSIVAL